MLDKDKLINKLNDEIDKLEFITEHSKYYNFKNLVIRTLIKSGIAIDYALPFILATMILLSYKISTNDIPFYKDQVKKDVYVETIDTSTGIHEEKTTYDENITNNISFSHSTGWIINDNGLFERTETVYQIDDLVDLTNQKQILELTKEEIDHSFNIISMEKIQKSFLTEKDDLYNEEVLIINKTQVKQALMIDEESKEVVIDSILFLIFSFLGGKLLEIIKNVFIKETITDKLNEIKPKYRPLKQRELTILKRILELKRENLEMLDEDTPNINRYKVKRK